MKDAPRHAKTYQTDSNHEDLSSGQ
jgi:hypothetical protein